VTYLRRCEGGLFDGYAEEAETVVGRLSFPTTTGYVDYRLDKLYRKAGEVPLAVYVPEEEAA
jgi:hypothetical protein